MNTLPVELLGVIAGCSTEAYRAMCLVQLFARGLNPGVIASWQIHFGHSVEISRYDTQWLRHGVLHRVDGPARVTSDGTWWFYNGKPHRVDGPALEFTRGIQVWSIHGQIHRDGGPAVISDNGVSQWWCHRGEIHREDGPAEILPDGTQCWYRNGVIHRGGFTASGEKDGVTLAGPSIVKPNGVQLWTIGNVAYDASGNIITSHIHGSEIKVNGFGLVTIGPYIG